MPKQSMDRVASLAMTVANCVAGRGWSPVRHVKNRLHPINHGLQFHAKSVAELGYGNIDRDDESSVDDLWVRPVGVQPLPEFVRDVVCVDTDLNRKIQQGFFAICKLIACLVLVAINISDSFVLQSRTPSLSMVMIMSVKTVPYSGWWPNTLKMFNSAWKCSSDLL